MKCSMRPYYFLFLFGLIQFGVSAQTSLADPILLWPQGAPGAKGSSDEDKPALIPFIPDKSVSNGTAVLVIPGGGFTIRAVDHEGVLVSHWLKERGITAFLLRYRLRPLYDRADWLNDGERAMQYIRANALNFGIDPTRVGAVGFSAGANLVADLGFNATLGDINAAELLDQQSALPNFNILAYGAMTFPKDLNPDKLRLVPPTFMFGTVEDAGSLNGMNTLFSDFVKSKVPVEAHFFQNGVHGSGFAIGDPILGEWPHLLHNWMLANGFLSAKKRTAINGLVMLDGKPLLRGIIIFKPLNAPNDPPAIVYMTNTGTGELGRFTLPANQGPVIGKYEVEVRQEATRWTSNSRDPFMIKMMEAQRNNTLTDNDRKEWGAYLRKRNLNPSIDKQAVFIKQKPTNNENYIIDIKDDKDILIEVFSK